ncbi:hypothetical protein BDV95DRAFT_239705 [Massariosphaeria phaeospora]|uniref:Uncharacterized protein n=1 Tax=Massariosphaeria phaeospora TaxID=100035 RepID=A0A7C8I3A7_9PLEO|nr:hypothetical protein BDV95DRAFT_239705 [Massariosphaeria phaeospora]
MVRIDLETPFEPRFPEGWDASRIRHLRLELQLPYLGLHQISFQGLWSMLHQMQELKVMQICIPSGDFWDLDIWHYLVESRRATIRDLYAAIPLEVERVDWGPTWEQRYSGDFGGMEHLHWFELRKLCRIFEGFRGIDAGMWRDGLGNFDWKRPEKDERSWKMRLRPR